MPSTADKAREWRTRNPEAHAENARRQAARTSAALEVARRYPHLWRRLFEEICAERGLDPYPPVGRPPFR